jgi:putative PIN family toxin of toxin-antitoxin system
MIRVVIDTNTIVSAFIVKHPQAYPQRIYQAILNQQILPLTSTEAIEELEDVLPRPHIARRHKLTPEEVAQAIDEYAQACEFVDGQITVQVIEDDPDDDVFLAIALEGRADYIVSGNRHLLDLKALHGIPILSPRDFVETVILRSN